VPLGNRRRIFVRKSRRQALGVGVRVAAAIVFAGAGALGGMKLAAAIGTNAPRMADFAAPEPAAPVPRHAALAGENVAVVDGETLRLSGQVVRLAGVAAPQRGESCRLATDCAGAAASRLATLVRDQRVACTVNGADKIGRPVASCQAGGTDINRAVVASGWAFAAASSPGLKEAEESARAAHLGLWAEQ
jgi:endonuclease YncB( thermonuclease family)